MGKWIFLESRPDRSATGDAFRNSFEGEDMTEVLARESVQNSVDAAPPETTCVDVRYVWLHDCALGKVLDRSYRDHAQAGGVTIPLQSHGPALCVEDYNTYGLRGSMSELKSDLYMLMGRLGGSGKSGGAGGSFGYGKAACIMNSAAWTVIAFTITSHGPALFGTTYLNGHELDGRDYIGIGWFGDPTGTDVAPEELRGDAAVELAKKLGIPRAFNGEVGTSLLIPHCTVNRSELMKCVERFWWPRIIDHRLQVRFEEGAKYELQLQTDPALPVFRELYDVAEQRRTAVENMIRVPVQRNRRHLGTLVLKFDSTLAESAGEDQRAFNGIALMRDTRMVINYYSWRQGPRPGVVGVFVADPFINAALRQTEPHRHDDWSEKATRATQEQRDIASHVKEGIRKHHNDFLKTYNPPPSEDNRSLAELKRFFSQLIPASGGGGGGRRADPIEIYDKSFNLIEKDGSLVMEARARYRWKGRGQGKLVVGAMATVAESDTSIGGEPLPITIRVADSEEVSGTTPQQHVTLGSQDSVPLVVRTDPYDPNWTVAIHFAAEVAD